MKVPTKNNISDILPPITKKHYVIGTRYPAVPSYFIMLYYAL